MQASVSALRLSREKDLKAWGATKVSSANLLDDKMNQHKPKRMKTEGSRSGLSILAGGLFFVGAANAVDIVVDGSYESSTNNITGFVGAGGDDNGGLDGGWTHFSTYTYAANYTQAGPPASGQAYLRPYNDAVGSQTVSQTNSLTRAINTNQIDNVTGQYTLSAWFSTYKDQNDYSELTLQYLDGSMANLGSPVTLGGEAFVAALPGGSDLRAWGRDTKTGLIPPGARYAAITTVSHALLNLPDGYVDLVSLDITAGYVAVQVSSASPGNNAVIVIPAAILSVTLQDGTAPLNTNSIQLSYDNVRVTPAVQKSGATTTVRYDPPGLLAPLSTHTYEIAFNNAGDSTPNTTNRYTFKVAYFYEGFETAQALVDWDFGSGNWEIGRPTFGPSPNALGSRAHEGTNCAATVLGGNYTENASSRLISTPFIVPPAATNPRLRFWHWYSFNQFGAGADFGEVQIKAGTNDWKAISPRFVNDSGGVWSSPSLDLSAYAGLNVQVAFYFESLDVFGNGGLVDVAPGWYVDEVTVLTGPITFNNPENWESGLVDWSAEKGTWEIGTPTFGPPSNALGSRAHEGTNCAATVLGGNYTENASTRLISPPFIVPPAVTNPRLRFWHWYNFNQFGAGADFGEVQIKAGTNDWKTNLLHYVNDSGGVWSRPSLILSAYAGQNIQLAFYFESLDVFGNGGLVDVAPGWYIDEVLLTHDFALLLLDSPIVRAQDAFCVSLGMAASTPASTVSFMLQAPAGNLSNVTLTGEGCWTNAIITPQPNSQWFVTLQNSCTTAPMGVRTIGSLCFTAASPRSAFVPLIISDLVVTNLDASIPTVHAFGSRAVVIANEPLLEAALGVNGLRNITLFGKPGTTYEIQRATDLNSPVTWTPEGTNTVSATLFTSLSLNGASSNAPVLFLRALEK